MGETDKLALQLKVILAYHHIWRGQFTKAEVLLSEALDQQRSIFKETDPLVLTAKARFSAESRLGECLFKQGKQLDRAETLLDQGYQELEKRRLQLPDKVRLEILGSALVRLAEFYEGTGRPAQAAEFKRKLADLEKFEGRRLLAMDFIAPL